MALLLFATAHFSKGLRPRSDHRPASRQCPVDSPYLFFCLHCCSVLPHSAIISPRVCGLKIWILQKPRDLKSTRRHGWVKKPRKLEIIGKDQEAECFQSALSSEGKPVQDAQLLNDSAEKITPTNSQSAESSSSSHQSTVSIDLHSPKGPLSVVERSSSAYNIQGGRTLSVYCQNRSYW